MKGKGSRRSSLVALLLSLALVLAAYFTSVAAAAQRPPTTKKGRYMLVEVQPPRADMKKLRLAMREDGSSVAGYANGRQQWSATPGGESLLQSGYYVGGDSRHRSGPVGQGLGTPAGHDHGAAS